MLLETFGEDKNPRKDQEYHTDGNWSVSVLKNMLQFEEEGEARKYIPGC